LPEVYYGEGEKSSTSNLNYAADGQFQANKRQFCRIMIFFSNAVNVQILIFFGTTDTI
jgi:hypothetical protein